MFWKRKHHKFWGESLKKSIWNFQGSFFEYGKMKKLLDAKVSEMRRRKRGEDSEGKD